MAIIKDLPPLQPRQLFEDIRPRSDRKLSREAIDAANKSAEVITKKVRLARAKAQIEEVTKSKGGRPSTTGQPWKEEGISRVTWYRRQKQAAAKSETKS